MPVTPIPSKFEYDDTALVPAMIVFWLIVAIALLEWYLTLF